MKYLHLVTAILILAMCIGCKSKSYNYKNLINSMPKSILVLPPINDSPEVNATYSYYSAVSKPLAERGYYVYPVSVIDSMFKDNGLFSANDIHQVPLSKIYEIVGPDAVLYLTIHDYGTSYQIINSSTVVRVSGSLVDTKTGRVLWTGGINHVKNSSSGNDGIAGMVATALVSQIFDTATDAAHKQSFDANHAMFSNRNYGLLYGHRHKSFKEEQRKRRLELKERAAKYQAK